MSVEILRQRTAMRRASLSRPVALAATITLCLAITFEIVRNPGVQPSGGSGLQEQDILAPADARVDEINRPDAKRPDEVREDQLEAAQITVSPEAPQNSAAQSRSQDLDEHAAQNDALAEAGLADFADDLAKDKETARLEADQQWAESEPDKGSCFNFRLPF